MQDELLAVIDKNLPAAIGEQLRKRLEQAAKTDKENAKLQEHNTELQNRITTLDNALQKHAIMDGRERDLAKKLLDLDSRTIELSRRELAMDAQIAEIRAQEASNSKHDIYRLAEIALGKRAYTERVERSGHRDQPYGHKTATPLGP